jgi:hypothetical protein
VLKHLKTYQIFESSPEDFLTEEQIMFLDKGTGKNSAKSLGSFGTASSWGASGGVSGYTFSKWFYDPESKLVNVEGDFSCDYEDLKDFLGINFGEVTGDFNCSGQSQWFISLQGAPRTVGRDFYCNFNRKLTTLEGAPLKVGRNFFCKYNNLKNLVGGPLEVKGSYDVTGNNLSSLKGAPVILEGAFTSDRIYFRPGSWDFNGWNSFLTGASKNTEEILLTLGQLNPDWWLDLYRENRKLFNQIWIQMSSDPKILKNSLFQKVEKELGARAKENIEILRDMKDFGF